MRFNEITSNREPHKSKRDNLLKNLIKSFPYRLKNILSCEGDSVPVSSVNWFK